MYFTVVAVCQPQRVTRGFAYPSYLLVLRGEYNQAILREFLSKAILEGRKK